MPKVEARAQSLRGEALLALERRQDAEQALREAVRIAERIAYPRATWDALGLLAETARRDGRSEDAARAAAERRRVLDTAAASLGDTDLRRALARYAAVDVA